MKKVGKDIVEGVKPRKFAYRDVVYDEDDWVDANEFLPLDYDLMFVKLSNDKFTCAWTVGKKWDGLRLKADQKVVSWKKRPNEIDQCKAALQ